MTTIVYFADPTKEDVEIAGNFTGWTPEKLHLNKESGRFEYIVTPSEKAGQLNFKFIVDGNWVCDQNYASELDSDGNENNVILYDNTEGQQVRALQIEAVNKTVQKEIEQEPVTPDPTPRRTLSINGTIPQGESTTASKHAEPTPVTVEQGISLPVATTGDAPTSTQIPEPQPISRPSAPSEITTSNGENIPKPTPVARTDNQVQTTKDGSQPNGRRDQPREVTFSFFARVLQLITEFFRRWFRLGA